MAYSHPVLMLILRMLLMTVLHSIILTQGFEYCSNEEELCEGKTKVHIMCNEEQIEPKSEYQKHFLMTHKLRDIFTYWHNFYRNEVACGNVTGKDGTLPTAKQMRELVWDYELEHLAYVHAGRCHLKHDKCRNTKRMPLSGQNLSEKGTSQNPNGPIDRAYGSATAWFEEHADVTVDIIANFKKTEEKIGHFTVMVNDVVGRLGCAITWGKTDKLNYTYVTCNYDYTNVETLPVYLEGESASNCNIYGSYGKSSNFSCLCATTFKKNNTTVLF